MTETTPPFATLFDLPFGKAEGIVNGAIVALGLPMQSASPRRIGTARGPAAIRKASSEALQAYRASPSQTVVDLSTGQTKRLRVPEGSLDIGDLALNGQVSTHDLIRIADLIAAIAAEGGLPVALGGDHRVLEGVIKGLQSSQDCPAIISISDKITLPAAVDAAPLPLATLVSPATEQPAPLLCIGVNGLQSGASWVALERGGGVVVTAEDLYESHAATLNTINRFIGDHPSLVFCLDLEVIDAGYAAGTPAVNVGGLTPEQLLDLLRQLDQPAELAGVVVTNVAPNLDARGLTELAASEALVALLEHHLFEEVSQ